MGDDGHDSDLELPIKLGPCSNGEYVPPPMTPIEAETIRRTHEAADTQARRLGVSRRRFLRSVSGAALMLLTLDATARAARAGAAGGRYLLHPDAAGDLAAARAAIAGNELIFDVQVHYLNYDLAQPGGLGIAALFPQQRCGESDPRACFSVDHVIEEMFLKSDTSKVVMSAIPIPGDGNPLSIDDMELVKMIMTELCGRGRVLVQGQTFPSIDDASAQRDQMATVRKDHKVFGLVGGNNRPYASPVDVGPAAKANPDIKFVIYHSGYEPEDKEGPYSDATADVGVNRLIKTAMENGIGKDGNVYPELGSTWRSVMSDPTQAAHVLGKLLKQFGPDRVVWGTDSIWYGSPQDQIQAFRAFEITPQFQEQFGYPALTPAVKEKILGKTSARIYKIKSSAPAKCDFTREELEQVRQELPTGARTYGPKTGQEVAALIRAHGWA